jgi:hypothetical protein
MKVDMNYKFKEIDGKVVMERVVDEYKDGNPKRDGQGFPLMKLGKAFTLRAACLSVLTNPPVDIDQRSQRPKEVGYEEKLKMADLAQRIYKCNGLVDLNADEIVLLKDLINKRYLAPLTIKQAYDILDPTTKN